MKKIHFILVLLFSVVLTSCNNKDMFSGKHYVYNLEFNINEVKVFSFDFTNDSIASVRFTNAPLYTFNYKYTPSRKFIEFELIDNVNTDSVCKDSVLNSFKVERAYANQLVYEKRSYSDCGQDVFINRTKSFIDQYYEKLKQLEQEEIEKQRLAELKQKLDSKFNKKCDDFTNKCWVHHRSEPRYRNCTHSYMYFQMVEDTATNLRIVVQYAANDWLFIKRMIFNIDGENYDFIPQEMEKDNYTTIWEWCDESCSYHLSLVEALYSAKEVKIRYIGSQYHSDKVMPSSQLKAIQETIDYYKACGGK